MGISAQGNSPALVISATLLERLVSTEQAHAGDLEKRMSQIPPRKSFSPPSFEAVRGDMLMIVPKSRPHGE